MRATIVPPSPSPLASAPSAAPYDTPTDLDVWMQVDALQWLFGSPRPIWPPGLESHCLRALFDRIAVLAVDLAVTGYILDDQTLMAAAERHMPDSCSALRIIMRCPYPPTFAAYADEIIRLASLSGKAALYRDAMQRLETSIILPTAPVDVHDLYRQIHFTSVAAADWSRAMDGLHMDDCLLQLYLARALPVSYAPLRVTVRRVAPSTFGDYCAMLIVLASVDTARLSRGLPALSANATDAFDFLRELQNPLLTLPPPQSPQLPPMSSSLPSLMLPLPSPPPTLQAQAQLSPILPWSPLRHCSRRRCHHHLSSHHLHPPWRTMPAPVSLPLRPLPTLPSPSSPMPRLSLLRSLMLPSPLQQLSLSPLPSLMLSPSSGQEGLRLGFARSGIGPCAVGAIGLGSGNMGIILFAIGTDLSASPIAIGLRWAHPMVSLTFVPALRLGGAVTGCVLACPAYVTGCVLACPA